MLAIDDLEVCFKDILRLVIVMIWKFRVRVRVNPNQNVGMLGNVNVRGKR